MSGPLGDLALLYAELSLLAVGGGTTILPEMQRQVVEVHHWMSAHDFAALYALAQAAPGPNMLIATLVGWHVAGFAGALVATLALCAPSGLLAGGVSVIWWRFRDALWRRRLQAGLLPVTAGLMLAGAAVIAVAAVQGPVTGAIVIGTTAVLLATRLNPLWLLGAGAALGAFGFA